TSSYPGIGRGYAAKLDEKSPARTNTASDSTDEIATVRIELQHNDPLIRRQVTKCGPQSGSRSCTISSRPSWAGATIICGSLTSTDEYGLAMDEDWGGTPRSLGSHVRLRDVLKPGRTVIDYTYDFGDCWEHRLTVTDVRAGQPGVSYPRYVGGERNGPPEDCGGISGFYEWLTALGDPC
ncbi:MAG: plasmid pRiA4b ORF-3 family protein, partial [Pseudolabrys sp.]